MLATMVRSTHVGRDLLAYWAQVTVVDDLVRSAIMLLAPPVAVLQYHLCMVPIPRFRFRLPKITGDGLLNPDHVVGGGMDVAQLARTRLLCEILLNHPPEHSFE